MLAEELSALVKRRKLLNLTFILTYYGRQEVPVFILSTAMIRLVFLALRRCPVILKVLFPLIKNKTTTTF